MLDPPSFAIAGTQGCATATDAANDAVGRRRVALALVALLLVSGFLFLVQPPSDPLAQFRAPDGSLHIPGGSFTPALQRLLFGGNDLQPFLNLSTYAPARSPYRTADLAPTSYLVPNPNVFVHPARRTESLPEGLARVAAHWFPPVDWGAQFRALADGLLRLVAWDARAAVTTDPTRVSTGTSSGATCTTSQAAAPGENAVIVILSQNGTTAYASVTYGTTALSLLVAANGGTTARIEIWGFAGTLPTGTVTMTASTTGLVNRRQTCATILLSGVYSAAPFVFGVGSSGTTANAGITLGETVQPGNLGIGGLALASGTRPTDVAGTGATAISLFGTAATVCAGGRVCGAGADIAYPGTALTWTSVAAQWATAAIEVVQIPCGAGGASCYRIGSGGAWNSPTNWAVYSGGPACGCIPAVTDLAVFDANPSGTTTLSAATTIAAIDMTGFTGTLDTGSSWPLTVNGDLTIQGAFTSNGSSVSVSGDVTVLGTGTVVNLGSSTWTVNGIWTNNSTSPSWVAGTSSVAIRDAASGTLTFGNLGVNEFNDLTLDSSVVAGATYTMAVSALRMGGTLLIQNSAAGATGTTTLATGTGPYFDVTAGSILLGTLGGLSANSSNVSVAGNFTTNGTSAVWVPGTSTVTFVASGTTTLGASQTLSSVTVAAGTLTFGSAITASGNVTVGTGASLTTSAANYALTVQGAFAINGTGYFATGASTVSIVGSVSVTAAAGYITAGAGGAWTVSGAWSNASTSGLWAFAAPVTFNSSSSQTMAFAGTNLPGNEFASVTLNSGASLTTFTMSAHGLTAGTVTIQGGAGTTTLVTSGLPVTATTVTVAAGGALTAGSSTLTVTGMSTAAGTFAAGTSTILVNASSGTLNVPQAVYNLTVAPGLSTTLASALIFGGALTVASATVTFNSDVASSGATAVASFSGAALTVGGSWDTSTVGSANFTATTSSVSFTGTGKSVAVSAGSAFATVIVSGTISLGSPLTVSSLTIPSGGLTKGTNALTVNGDFALSGGYLTSVSGNVSIGGNVGVSAPGSYIAFGSETWTVSGSWTNASTSSSWSVGTATVVFNSPSNRTLTLMAGSAPEFYNLSFTGTSPVTFTLAANGLRVANALTVQGSPGTTTLSTASLSVATSALTVAAGGSLVANGSTITVRSMDTSSGAFAVGTSTIVVNSSGGTINVPQTVNNLTVGPGVSTTFASDLTFAGTLTLTSAIVGFSGSLASSGPATLSLSSATLTLGGSWDTSSAGSLTAGASVVTFTGTAATVALAAGQSFASLVVTGTLSQISQVTATSLTVGSGSLTQGPYPLTVNGNLILSGGALLASSQPVAIAGSVNVSSAASYIVFGSGGWTVAGSWSNGSTSASWSAGTATVTFSSASPQTMSFAGANLSAPEFANVVFDTTAPGGVTYTMSTRGLTVAGSLTVRNTSPGPTGNAILTTSGAGLPITVAGTLTVAANGALVANGSTITFQSFDASAGSFTAGTSTLVAAASASTIAAGQALYNLTVNPGVTLTAGSDLTVNGTLSVGGVLAAAGRSLAVATLAALSGGVVGGPAGSMGFAGNVLIGSTGYFAFGGASWTFAGSWTNNSTSASWSAGTATVTFTSATGGGMTFAGTNLPGNAAEFYNVTFDAGASTATFTLAANGLVWAGTLAVHGTGGTTLATSGLGLSGGSLAVGNGGTLTTAGSDVTVTDVTMTGGSSGAIAATTGSWTVRGNWDTSGAGSMWSAGSSTVTFTGASKTIALGPGQSFGSLVIGGTVSLLTALTAAGGLSVNTGAALTKTGHVITFNGLAVLGSGVIVDGSLVVSGFTVTNSDPTNLTTISAFTRWAPDGESQWAHTSTVATSTLTFTLAGNTSGQRFMVTKDGVDFTTGFVDASGQVVFTMLGSDPVVDVIVAAPCGTARYWVGGTGSWSQTAHWSATSGGAGGCNVPDGGKTVAFDANSGGGTVTVNQDANLASLDTTGWTGSLAVGTFAFAVGGNLILAGGSIAIGASSGGGLTVAGNLLLSGVAFLDGSGAASVVSVGGDVSITSATGYIRMGSGTWTFAGSWSNASTSANWSAGSGTVVFDAAASRTMTFASLGAPEFHNLTFASPTAGSIVFTLATNPLRWSGALTIQGTAGGTTTMTTADVGLVGGDLVVGNSGAVVANASAVSVGSVTMTGGTSGRIVVTTGAWTVSGDWDTSGSGSMFVKGTGSVALAGSGHVARTLDASNGFYTLVVSGTIAQASAIDVSSAFTITGTWTTLGYAITGGANLVVSGGGRLLGTTSSIAVRSVTMNDAAANTLSLTTGSLLVSGSWDTSGAASTFDPGTGTVTLSAATGTVALGPSQSFAALIVTGGYTLATPLSAGSLTLTGTGLAKGTNALTLSGDLVLGGGYLTSVSGDIAVAGSVTISSPSSYIVFGSEAWTVSGSWTNDSTAASWSAGTGRITFNAGTAQTLTFAGSHLAAVEFNAVLFNAGTANVAFTLAGPGLRAHTITIQGGTGTTSVDTSSSSVAITADTLTIAAGGSLVAHGSTITVRSLDSSAGDLVAGTSLVVVAASGGVINVPQELSSLTVSPGVATTIASNLSWSAGLILTGATVTLAGNLAAVGLPTLEFASSTLTVAGSWDSSAATLFEAASSSVTLTGTGQTLALGAGQAFADLTIAGTVTVSTDLTAASLTVDPSGRLTKTGHAIAFNALTVNGAIEDGAVTVTGLTVANSDATALVTITVFSAWSPGSEYAWTHTSSETSQTITWTIRGNAPAFLYRITKNGSDFADGAVPASGEIVLRMTGSDPDMRITVGPPPWWMSPFFLGSLPIPFIVVVAMFVQRRRWRPVKAFLVDERHELLREFNLDPSCEVTYDQAVQAGALDAVDKDVRVSKYHARAVHGDTLSLVMLAIGPADGSELEFARGLLEKVQDRLEGRVLERIQAARAEEATAEGARAQANEELADLHARSRVFGDMVNAFTIARSKVDADSHRLRSLDEDIRSREARVAEDRHWVKEQGAQLAEERSILDRTASEVETQKARLEELRAAVQEREDKVKPKEKELKQREKTVSERESDATAHEQALAAAQAELASNLDEYRVKTETVHATQTELAEERKALDELSVHLDRQQVALEEKAAAVDGKAKENASLEESLQTRLKELEPREQALGTRESELSTRETSLVQKEDALTAREEDLHQQLDALRARDAALANRERDLEDERKALDDITSEAIGERKKLDTLAASLAEREADVARKTEDLTSLRENLGPREAALVRKEEDLEAREKDLAHELATVESQQDLVAAKALEIQQRSEELKESETAIEREKMLLRDAKAALEADAKDVGARKAELAARVQAHEAAVEAEKREMEETRARLAKEAEAFEVQRAERGQWIASKEIELEAKEQGFADREAEIRAQVEANGQRLAELAAREETLEIDADKLDKARAEAQAKKAEIEAAGRELRTRQSKFQEEEAKKGEELRTWQATLESEQALMKEQRETFEKEMQELRESWAGRMIRVEQREEELQERESKVQADIEWVAKNEGDLTNREKAVAESLRAANEAKTALARAQEDLDQRTLEIESRERSLQEEAAAQAVELEKRTEAVQVQEAELAGRKAQSERELANLTQKLSNRDAELQARKATLDAHETDLASRENALAGLQSALRQEQDRLAREKADAVALGKQNESKQLELGQARERLDAEARRLQNETDAVRQSLAAQEADLSSERQRLERESTALQDTLGAKAKELAARERALAAHEADARVESQELDARMREIELREKQAEAHLTELMAREKALTKSEGELSARRATFDQAVLNSESEAKAREQEWKDLQETLKSQEAELAADTETRHAEIRKRMEDLEQRERALNAALTQSQIERTRLEDQAKAQTARQADLDAAGARADKRFGELKATEGELLKSRQAFESEKAAWTTRRNEELKQLEATRDAAAEQVQQSERLIEEAQRHTFVAAEAEKTAKRQEAAMATAQIAFEKRRTDAEKAEKDLAAQTAQLRDASQRLATKELELGSRAKELDALQARLADAERKNADTAETQKARKATLDAEAERIAGLATESAKRQAEDESRHRAIESKLAEVTKREQILSTELQRADHLMEDLNRKETEIVAREKGFVAREQELAKRDQILIQRDAELREGMQTLERLRREQESRAVEAEANEHAAAEARKEADRVRSDAEKLKVQADAMQAEVAKNMRFLQKKALDVLDREEKIRARENKVDEQGRLLESQAQVLEQKDRATVAEHEELAARLEKAKQENDKLRAKLAEAEKAGKSTIDMDEWKRDIDNRVKIIQKKALDLLDREEKLRKREEELRALAAQLGVEAKA